MNGPNGPTATPPAKPLAPMQKREFGGFIGALIAQLRRQRGGLPNSAAPNNVAANYALPGNLNGGPTGNTGIVPNVGLPTDALNIDPAAQQQVLASNPDFASAFHERTALQRNALQSQMAARRSPYGTRG